MTDSEDRPIRKISGWKVCGIFSLVSFLILLGMVFIPWDIKPVDDSDLVVQCPRLAPEENAFTWFEKAGKSAVETFPDWSLESKYGLTARIGAENERWNPVVAAEVLTANAAVFSDIEKGLACQRYVSPRESLETRLSPYQWMPWKSKNRFLAYLLYLKSKQAQLAGNQTEAVHWALQVFLFGQAISRDSNYLYEWEIGIRQESSALVRLEELVADAKTPEPVLAEILFTLEQRNPKGLADGYKNVMRGTYWFHVQLGKDFLAGKHQKSSLEWLPGIHRIPYVFKPNMMNRDWAAFYRHQIEMVDLPRSKIQSDYPSRPQDLGKASGLTLAGFLAKPNSVGTICVLTEAPKIEKAIENKFSLQASIIALRLKIRLRLYEKKYGQLPESLQSLVPEFISAVPNDPFDDKPFRYSKEKKLVWSVGEDGIDNGGKAYRENVMYANEKGYDAVMPLGTRELKPIPPSPKSSGSEPSPASNKVHSTNLP
jgi:hypothetical protein